MLNIITNVYMNMVPEAIMVLKNTDVSFKDIMYTGKLIVTTLIDNKDIVITSVKRWF